MNQAVDVSVIIPTYNRLWSLPRAINSCLNTTCITEIIVVDDGSTDGTWDWLKKQANIIAFYQPNQGQTYAANKGLEHAQGKYLRYLDSDDFLAEGTIDKQFVNAEKNQADLVYSRVDTFNEQDQTITKNPDIEPWNDFLEVQLGNGYGSHYSGMLFRSELAKKVPRRPDFSFRDDRLFLLEFGLLEPKISFEPGCAGYWVKHPEQMQANYRGLKSQVTNWQHLNIFKKILGELNEQGKLTQQRKNSACTVLWPLAHWIAKNHLNEAVEVVNWIYELNPDFKVPEKGFLGTMYNKLGFKTTEKILATRRLLKNI